MSREFSPRDCFIANEITKNKKNPYGIWLRNLKIVEDNKEWMYFSNEELEDRRNHPFIAILASDVYNTIRKMLNNEDFEALNNVLKELVEADSNNKDLSSFPEKIRGWYFNKGNYRYREEYDGDFLEYVENTYIKNKTINNEQLDNYQEENEVDHER